MGAASAEAVRRGATLRRRQRGRQRPWLVGMLKCSAARLCVGGKLAACRRDVVVPVSEGRVVRRLETGVAARACWLE
jgi:hypothetical protein